jgi:DNA-binding MarR family transcriptional regulator
MSHKATNWFSEVPADLMTSGEFRVLFFLADCHNPSRGCFPEQEFLRGKTGLSNGGLNKCLSGLESKKLIRRKQRFNPKTKTRLSTLYVLGCDESLTIEPTPQSGDGSNSTLGPNPTPLLGQSQLHPSGDKPVSEPVKEPCASEPEPQTPQMDDLFLDKFMAAFPRIGSLGDTEAALESAIASGVDPAAILAGARAYALEQKGNLPRYIAYSENWLGDRRWEKHSPKAADPAVEPSIEQSWIAAFTAGNGSLARHCPPAVVSSLIAAGHVTLEQCRALEVRV